MLPESSVFIKCWVQVTDNHDFDLVINDTQVPTTFGVVMCGLCCAEIRAEARLDLTKSL